MTIAPFSPGGFQTRETVRNLGELRRAGEALERQLATGKRAQTYSGLGAERRTVLDARARLAGIAAYQDAITSADIRIRAMNAGLERLDRMQVATRGVSLGLAPELSPAGVAQERANARNNLALAVEVLNTRLDGRYVFGGRASDTPPLRPVGELIAGLEAAVAALPPADQGDPAQIMAAVTAFFGTPANWRGPNVDASLPARDSVGARVSDEQTVAIGVRPDEDAIRNLLIGVGALAVASPAQTAPENYLELARRADALIGSGQQIREISAALAGAQGAIGVARERHETMKGLLEEMRDGVELVPTEEAAVSLLQLQSRLQASYQATATLSRLSLVNFL